MNRYFVSLLVIICSCNAESDKLFWIDENKKNRNDFLYMVESTNVKPIHTDSLKLYLTTSEIQETKIIDTNTEVLMNSEFQQKSTYKHFGKLIDSADLKLHVILRDRYNSEGRDYQFILRTFDKNYKILDSYILSDWNEIQNKYCFGEINKSLEIRKKCKKNVDDERYMITESGFFKPINQIQNE